MTAEIYPQRRWSRMRSVAAAQAGNIIADKQSFRLQLQWPNSYEELLASADAEITPENSLLERTLQKGRVILAAEAGAGKTWLLARIAQLASSTQNVIPVLIQLKNLSALQPVSETDDLEFTIRNLLSIAVPDPRSALIVRGNVPPFILLLDGLNEVSRTVAEPVITAVDELARRYPFLSVLVTDRLVRRAIDPDRWNLVTILPLSDDEVQRVWTNAAQPNDLPKNIGLLNRPFFLDTALSTDITASSEAGTIDRYFRQIVHISSGELDDLANTAFDAYAQYHGITMPEDWLHQHITGTTYEHLVESGAVRNSGGRVWFTHHLLHDFLAARSLSQHESVWGPDAFDVVTLTAASFDSLRLTVEQLADIVRADRLIRRVYDWNYYGAAYALVPGSVSEETRTVILAMLADKKWDAVAATVTLVTDALRVDGSATSRQLLAADDRSEIFRVVRQQSSEQSWFADWVKLFTTPDGTVADESMIEGLRTEDSIVSWTLANVLRRCRIEPTALNRLLTISEDASPVIRWRAIHVLGAIPSVDSIQSLKSRLQDSDKWVRYGAVRSIVEIAARTPELSLRDIALSALHELLQQGRPDESVIRELSRALDVVHQPDGWAYAVAPIIQQLIGLSETRVEQDKWGLLMASIVSRSSQQS
jgi:hypothetical protein